MIPRWPDGVVVRRDEPLARHSALRTGGACDALVWVHAREALPAVIDACRAADWRWHLLGAGTRAVYRDGGLTGAVIRLGTGFSGSTVDRDRWDVGAATPCAALAFAAARAGAVGIEDLAAVPGTLGASLALDPGPGAGWTDVLDAVRYLHRGQVRDGTLEEARKGRRIIVGARLRLRDGDPGALRDRCVDRLAAGRAWSCYAVRGDPRRLLRRVALGDVRLRQALIPAEAPEMLVNLGGARSGDLALLAKSAADRVRRERGVGLEPAIRWAGRM